MEGITGSVLLMCFIGLIDANTSPSIEPGVFSICEDIPIDQPAFTILATDVESDPLTYEINGPNAAYFTVNSTTGVASIQRNLDREASNYMTLGVYVYDGQTGTQKDLTLIIEEANDNKPIFKEPSYDIDVKENTTIGTSLFKAEATDADTSSAGVITYSIDEVTPSAGFSLFSIVPTTGEVRLDGNLNYTDLSTFYRLKINATDGGGACYFRPIKNYFSSVAFSFVTVVDVPDLDPQFIGLPYVGKVEENASVGSSVFEVTAMDQDTGVNDILHFSIEDSTAVGLFTISQIGGVISVLSGIDREKIGDTVTLTVKATESKENIHGVRASTTTDVQINIIDKNDNPPKFYKCGDTADELSCVIASDFTGDVVEHSLGAVFINMTVKDLDKIKKMKLNLEGVHSDVFSVEPQSTASDSIVQLLVKQPQNLDYEEIQTIVLSVIAIDEEDTSFHSTATVTINIKDANDNSPEFEEDTYKLKVAEHSPVGTVLDTITAEDLDTMDKGNITYKLLPESILLYFDVDPHTGAVYVKNETLLDREVRSLYSATLQARDTDGKPGSTVLEITLNDINDHPPVMNRDSYQEFVKEGQKFELKIQATDADESDTQNSQLVFGIELSSYSDNFTINTETGVLTNSGKLDREALDPDLDGRIELNVTATDNGTPSLSTMVPVIINVEDVNDNGPEFKVSSYKFSVKEGEKGAFVGSVQAEDLDQTTEFNRISYSIINGGFGSFIIRTFADERGYSGNITVDFDLELDYESTRKQYKLQVEAADLEQLKATVMVEVNVLDVNDERPEFKPSEPVKVKENTTISGAVGSFTAQDKDGHHSLVYELESIKCRCNGSMTDCSWFILDPTGEVRVNPEHTMDYEQCDLVVIEAQVVDEYTEKGENNSVTTGEMVIEIEDINDNAPEFILSNSVFVVVSESASKGTSVAGVSATDRDSLINRQVEFEVTAVQFEDNHNKTTNLRMLYEAVTTQQKDIYVGIIQTTEGLDTTLKGRYLVTVRATDSGKLSTSTVLEIFAVDESYKVNLKFTQSQAMVEENLNEIIRALISATKAAVEIAAIRPESPKSSRASGNTIIVAYFVYSNGTALTSTEVETMISDPDHAYILIQLGLADIGKAPVIEAETDPLRYILMGMVAGLVVVLTVLTTSLMCTRRNYRRKLKAAKAMNSASMVTSNNQKSGPVVPGTNKYTMEGANPVLNLNIDTTMVLDMDEDSSDVDKVSLNSLDDSYSMNEISNMKSIQEVEEEEGDDGGPPKYIEPLGAALAQRGQKKASDKPHVGFINPAFSTTDL
ncbi:Cadherin-related family member 2 [Dissostichus eleginoides]|uniref:Cadherin-related family member 2 n=1 Tax=Dissostichus eleginoides TaxID=100907 RepID=A0AAD9CME1_DISEL|nr:Cadherin-related family member 2 [Dissostichus eleginoides]